MRIFKRILSSRPTSQTSSHSSSSTAAAAAAGRRKITVLSLHDQFQEKRPITVMTAHDYPSAALCDKAGMDIVLVGDSLAMVTLGHESTATVTVDEMLHHCRAVKRGVRYAFTVGDMPFGSYQVSEEHAVRNAIRFIQEGGMEAVKLEGPLDGTVKRIVQAGVPVMGHLGLTPQSQTSLGGYRVQGKTADKAMRLLEDAHRLADAGCFAMVLEAMPEPVARRITESLDIPTIGIGAGKYTSGQVLVQQDALGIFDRFQPRFCKTFANLNESITGALEDYGRQVRTGQFPTTQHTYPMDLKEAERFLSLSLSFKRK